MLPSVSSFGTFPCQIFLFTIITAEKWNVWGNRVRKWIHSAFSILIPISRNFAAIEFRKSRAASWLIILKRVLRGSGGDAAQIRESNRDRGGVHYLRVALVISFSNSRILDHRATTNRSKFSEMRRDMRTTPKTANACCEMEKPGASERTNEWSSITAVGCDRTVLLVHHSC